MTGSGRKRTLEIVHFGVSERPLSGKADVIVLRLSTEDDIEFRGNATAVHCAERTCQ